jgi:hypothetical protein
VTNINNSIRWIFAAGWKTIINFWGKLSAIRVLDGRNCHVFWGSWTFQLFHFGDPKNQAGFSPWDIGEAFSFFYETLHFMLAYSPICLPTYHTTVSWLSRIKEKVEPWHRQAFIQEYNSLWIIQLDMSEVYTGQYVERTHIFRALDCPEGYAFASACYCFCYRQIPSAWNDTTIQHSMWHLEETCLKRS